MDDIKSRQENIEKFKPEPTKLIYARPVDHYTRTSIDQPTHRIYADTETGEIFDERGAIDHIAPEGEIVKSGKGGVVTFVSEGNSSNWKTIEEFNQDPTNPGKEEMNGNFVVINHEPGLGFEGERCKYCHLMDGSICVREGQEVSEGEPIGKVGNTGISRGPHVHTAYGSWIDEKTFLSRIPRFSN